MKTKEKSVKPVKPTKKHALKILELLKHGLTKGLGNPKPGKMCVEAVVKAAFDLNHGDNPPCVGNEVRRFKIALNDCDWPTNAERAKGMRALAIAQLGSDTLNQEEFFNLLKLKSCQQILPEIINKHAEKASNVAESLAYWIRKFSNVKTLVEFDMLWQYFYNYYYYSYNYYYYYYNYYNYNYNYNYYYYKTDFLLLITKVGLEVLEELKSPGCKWLHLIKD